MQQDVIHEQLKENNQDKESWVLTKIHVLGEEAGTSGYLSGMLLCTHICVFICVHRSAFQYACEYDLLELT